MINFHFHHIHCIKKVNTCVIDRFLNITAVFKFHIDAKNVHLFTNHIEYNYKHHITKLVNVFTNRFEYIH